jgi:hypothetical protein
MPPDLWPSRLRAIVGGTSTSAQIESWVDTAWNEGRGVDEVPAAVFRTLPTTGDPVARYGDSGVLRSEVCFRHPDGPGGVVIHTPPMETWSSTRKNYCIAPHVHGCAHVTVVLAGEAHFFVAPADENRVVHVAARPGHVLLCPAGSAHTFGSKGEAFTVLSIHARFVDPSQRGFSRRAPFFDRLPLAARPVRLAS